MGVFEILWLLPAVLFVRAGVSPSCFSIDFEVDTGGVSDSFEVTGRSSARAEDGAVVGGALPLF